MGDKNMSSKAAKAEKREIVLIGARLDGHAGVVLDMLDDIGGYKVVAFVDNTPGLQGSKLKNIRVIGSTTDLDKINFPSKYVHIAIGDNVARGELFKKCEKLGLEVISLIHPSARISRQAEIKKGCFIGPRAVINNGVKIGYVSIINTGAIIEHDNNIGFAVHVAPGTNTAERVRIDDFAFVGIGSTILPDIHIGSGAMVGAGATVVEDVPSKTTIIGYAAKKQKKNIYVDTKADVLTPNPKIYIAQPSLPDYQLIDQKFRDIADTLMLSNFAKYSTMLENDIINRLGVKKALTLPNCTSALMLALKALELEGEVILPSFTFSATGHAVIWNNLTPVFADINRKTFCVDPDDVERKITKKTCAIIGVHVFGNPADIERLEQLARKYKLKLIFDSAHALGSRYHDKSIGGFGDVECFSLSGTKVITSAEGGIVTSNNVEFMHKMHLGRNYGADSDYDCQYIGLNGKMSEFHAAIALESMALIDKFVAQRNYLAELYKEKLSKLPGISFQNLPEGHLSTFKDFAVIIDKETFGLGRDEIFDRLVEYGIYSKKYFFPLHRMKAYQTIRHRAKGLKNTEYIADNIICLPIFSHMHEETVSRVCEVISDASMSVNSKSC
jgi:sugar O-acyltransferase (sialic acid O-acetyltransferase NeuD family)